MQELRWLICRTVFFFVPFVLPSLAMADVSCCTWNMKWFPSGKRNLRADASEERAKCQTAGRMFLHSLHNLDGGRSMKRAILFVQEVRDAETCTNLVSSIGIDGMKVASVSDFKDRIGLSLWQQTAILTTFPVIDAGFEAWRGSSGVTPPRGFTYALLDAREDGHVLCFSVHLKSNLNQKGTEFEEQANIYKRECCAAQILAVIARYLDAGKSVARVVIAGDFNTNEDDPAFVSEATLRSFYGAHFRSCFTGMKKKDRVTHPGRGVYADATFDYILYKGFERARVRRIFTGDPVSDHHIVSVNLVPESP